MITDGTMESAKPPSRTAAHVAARRLGFERPAVPFGDAEADDRLARDVSAGVDPAPTGRMTAYLRIRTAFFDRFVLNALDRGVSQVVILGAGYDGRALRYGAPGARWFEVDHPTTQRDKRERLDRLGIATPGITFVPAQFGRDDVAAALLRAGVDQEEPAALLCEGVAVYLPADVLQDLLRQVRSVASAGTRLALSTGIPTADPARRAAFAARVAAWGEPAVLQDADVGAIVADAGWRPIQVPERARRVGLLVGVPV